MTLTTRVVSRSVCRPALALLVACSAGALAFDLEAHRGGRGLFPENTLAAFENALRLGVTTLELDIAITADGVPVVSHEPALYPGTARDAQGRWLATPGPLIHSLPLRDVQSYDVGRLNPSLDYGKPFAEQRAQDGQRIPTLASVFALAGALGANDVRFNIETKIYPNRPDDTVAPEAFVKALLAVIRAAGVASRTTFQSFDWRTLQLVQSLEPGIRTAYLTTRDRNGSNVDNPAWTAGRDVRDYPSLPHMVKAAGGAIWSPNFNALLENDVKQAHALGVQVLPWTVNDPADMRRLIEWGVDGIITDYPDRLRAMLRERGMALPEGVQR